MKKLALLWLIVAFLVLSVVNSYGDAGVLLPRDQKQPNPAVLSLEEMTIEVQIDNGDARVYKSFNHGPTHIIPLKFHDSVLSERHSAGLPVTH